MSVKVLYSDVVSLTEEVREVAVRNGSIEVNSYSNTVYGYRVNISGCWSIASTNGYNKELLEKLKQQALKVPIDECGDLADAELYKGRVEIGRELPDVDEVVKLLLSLCSEARGYNITKCEVVVVLRSTARSIERDAGDIAYELKRIVDVEIGLMGTSLYGLTSFASSHGAVVSWNPKDVINYLEQMFKNTMDNMANAYRLRPLKPYLYGRATVVLDHVAAAALFHELSHMLDATYGYGAKLVGYKLCSDDVEVYDEPYNIESASIRFFDDEGVISRKRTLIEKGVVRDLHHTRSTAKSMGSEPGSAYGLFHKPVAFHTTLVVKPGDWKYNEILEDTKRGFYIGGAVMATLEEGYIRIIPEFGYVIEDGELKEAVKIREVRIPTRGMKTISALSRDLKVRTSYEKSWLVSEATPVVRLEAYVQ